MLLNEGLGSAEGSTRHRANVCKGRRGDNDNLECKAESFAERRAASGGGDGSCVRSRITDGSPTCDVGVSPEYGASSACRADAADD